MGSEFNPSNRYTSTPRKVFDKAIDRMDLKRIRDREDHRNDLKAIFKRLQNLENQHALLEEFVRSHCLVLEDQVTSESTEEL